MKWLQIRWKYAVGWHFPFRWTWTFYINSIKWMYQHKSTLLLKCACVTLFGCKERNSIDTIWNVQIDFQTHEIFEYQILFVAIKANCLKTKMNKYSRSASVHFGWYGNRISLVLYVIIIDQFNSFTFEMLISNRVDYFSFCSK